MGGLLYEMMSFDEILDGITAFEPTQKPLLPAAINRLIESYTDGWRLDRLEEAFQTTKDYLDWTLAPKIQELLIMNGIDVPIKITDGAGLTPATRKAFKQLGKPDFDDNLRYTVAFLNSKAEEVRTREGILAQNPVCRKPKLDLGLNDEQRLLLYTKLIEYSFIPKDTDEKSFLWTFGGKESPAAFMPTVWMISKQSLRELIEPFVECITDQMKGNIAELFISKKKPLALNKRDKSHSANIQVIEKIVALVREQA